VSALYEIVPNISEGRDREVVDACVAAVDAAGARVIDRTSDEAHHRSVITAIGSRDAALAASVALAGVAVRRIDLRRHRGEHPRIGALDVLPFIPLRGATLDEAVTLAHEAGRAIWRTHRVPSYYYGAAASVPHRALLADVRRGEFEGLAVRIHEPLWAPDVGDAVHASAGAIAIGARPLLVAFNVDLESDDLRLAQAIARTLRERDGGLVTLRALGLRRSPGVVQVSFNITDYAATPIYRVVELVRALAADAGVTIKRSELIGLVPRRALTETAAYYLGE
jgi:glutamate formiminotransferase / 5-formyltetrahydrofolate cyclo-ligase